MAAEKSYWEEFTKGFYKDNPVSTLMLGLCPALAVTTAAESGLGMGLASTFVLFGSNVIVSLIKTVVPKKIRIPIYIVIIATFVTIVEMVMAAFFPVLAKTLGIYIPLIVVNCVILGRAEAFASKNSLFRSILDALGMGIGFTLFLTLLASIREILGDGKIFGFPLFGPSFEPVIIMILPPGAFILLGLMLGFFIWIDRRKELKEIMKKRKAPVVNTTPEINPE